jgi:hypothetical protein
MADGSLLRSGGETWGQCRPTMFTKQVSRPVDNLDAHRGPRGRAGRADSKKDLVTAQSEVFVPYRLLFRMPRAVIRLLSDGDRGFGPLHPAHCPG